MVKKYRLGFTRRAVNLLVTTMLKLGIGQKGAYLLTTTGRKTNQKRTTPVILVEAAPERWLVSPYGVVAWVHNVRANPEVTIRRGRRTRDSSRRGARLGGRGAPSPAICQQRAGNGPFLRCQARRPRRQVHRGSTTPPGVQAPCRPRVRSPGQWLVAV